MTYSLKRTISGSLIDVVDLGAIQSEEYKCESNVDHIPMPLTRPTHAHGYEVTGSQTTISLRGIVTVYAISNIAASTNSSPIQITTSTKHGLSTGMTATIANHLVNTNANGTWTITYITDYIISLNGSTGNGIGGPTGTVDGSLAVLNAKANEYVALVNPSVSGGTTAAYYEYTSDWIQDPDATLTPPSTTQFYCKVQSVNISKEAGVPLKFTYSLELIQVDPIGAY